MALPSTTTSAVPVVDYQVRECDLGNILWLAVRICCIVMNFDGDDGDGDGSPYSNIYFVNFKEIIQHYSSALSGYSLGILQHLASGS